MINGGSNGTLQSGNIRSGYSDLFIPAKAFLLPDDIIQDYNNSIGIEYSFKVWVKNAADWVYLSDAISFNITINPTGNFNTASVQVKNTLKWGIAGTEHTDLLKPGNSNIKITGTCTGVEEFAFFIGRLTNYDRSEAFGSASISLQASDVRTLLQRKTAEAYTGEQTTYRQVKRQLRETLQAFGITHAPQLQDNSGTFPVGGSQYSAVNSAINGHAQWYITSSGNLIITATGTDAEATSTVGEVISLTDANMLQLTRLNNEFNTFNTVRIAGYVGDTYTVSSVQNDADVLIRGNVYYPAGFIGTPTCQLTDSEDIATRMLAQIFNPAFNVDAPFFPFFEPGTKINIQSDRFNLSNSLTTIGKISHTYQHGQSQTTLEALYTEVI